MFILIIVSFSLAQLVSVDHIPRSVAFNKDNLVNVEKLNDRFSSEILSNKMGGLTHKYLGAKVNFNKSFEDFFSNLDSLFKFNYSFSVKNNVKINLLDFLKELFAFKHPNSHTLKFLKSIPDSLKINFCKSKNSNKNSLTDNQINFLQTFFSKGLFNEFRTKMSLLLLQAKGVITSFEHCPSFGSLDVNQIDFLIEVPTLSAGQSIFAIQVKSSETGINNCPRDGKIYINAHNKSLQQIADDIRSQILSPETTSIPVSEFSEDTSQWFDTLIRAFPKKTTQAG